MAGVRFLTPNLSDVHVRVSGGNAIVTVDGGVEVSILDASASIDTDGAHPTFRLTGIGVFLSFKTLYQDDFDALSHYLDSMAIGLEICEK
ncbi:hypothetical protein ACI1HS_003977 [Vibrio parahaemolyticus]